MKLIITVALAAALSLGLAAPAAAAPSAPQICATLDADPTSEAIVGLLIETTSPDSDADISLAGRNLAIAAIYTCPEHAAVINEFIEKAAQAAHQGRLKYA